MDINLKEEWSQSNLGQFGENSDIDTPFNFYIFPDFLDQESVTQLRTDINSTIKLDKKDNDLYKFKQSKDIKCEMDTITPNLRSFTDRMLNSLREHMEKVTGVKLSKDNFDITVSRYDVGDYLLCHNDDIGNVAKQHRRKLAFIYYLNTRQWTHEDGGALIMYNANSAGEPTKINNRICPKPNTLVIFETTPTSWHSVEEVYCKTDHRLSINGWFHTDEPINENKLEICPETNLFMIHRPLMLDERLEKFFEDYVNPQYMIDKTCCLVRRQFKKQSEINLTDFLIKEKYIEISQALKDSAKDQTNLVSLGPFNKRNYKRMMTERLPKVCKDLYDAFRSEFFFLFLWRLTGLELQPPGWKQEDPKMDELSQDDSDTDDESNNEEQSSSEDGEEDSEGEEEYDLDDEQDESIDEELAGDTCDENKNEQQRDSSQSDRFEVEKQPVAGFPADQSDSNSQNNTKSQEFKDRESHPKRQRVSGPVMRAEYRHLDHGAYTMIHDHDFELAEAGGLDVILHFNHDFDVEFDHGGYINYIDASTKENVHDIDQELLTIEPKSNCLSIIYRGDSDTCRFLKYVNRSHEADYQELSCVYYEKQDDLAYGGVGAIFDGHQSILRLNDETDGAIQPPTTN